MRTRTTHWCMILFIWLLLLSSLFPVIHPALSGDTHLIYGSVYNDHEEYNGPFVSGNLYLVDFDACVPLGETLTVQPGSQIDFVSGFKLTADGQLSADGTSSNPISFRSYGGRPEIKVYSADFRIYNNGYIRMGQGDNVIHRYIAPTARGTGTGESC